MRNEKNETMIFYLIKRSIFSNFFHFVIFALILMFSLNELMLRSFFIVMYKNLWCFEFDRFVNLLHKRKTIQQNNFQSLITSHNLKTRRETTSSSRQDEKKATQSFWWWRDVRKTYFLLISIYSKNAFDFHFLKSWIKSSKTSALRTLIATSRRKKCFE